MNQTQTAVVYKPAVTPSISPELIEYDTIIISDIHLGSPLCQAKELSEFLQQIRVKQLILAGDIFDDLKFNRLHHWHWEVLSRLRKISDHCRVVWIRGNHDTVSAPTLSHLLGVHVRNNYTWVSHGKRFYVVHGDRWDTIIYRHRRTTEFLTWIYNALMRINGSTTLKASRWIKRRAKLLTRNCSAIQFGAVAFARKKQIDAIFCGHTHMASLGFVDEILYGNDGTWQSDDPHFIGIRGTEVHLCKYMQKQSFQLKAEKL